LVNLLLFVLLSSALFINFRVFEGWNVDKLQVISINYLVCIVLGSVFATTNGGISRDVFFSAWTGWAILLGMLFLLNFSLTGITVEKAGLSIASVATKISLVLPFGFSFVMHNGAGFQVTDFIGLFFSGIAIWLVSGKGLVKKNSGKSAWFPLLIFLGTGTTDVLSQWCNETMVPQNERAAFVLLVFAGAFLGSVLFLTVRKVKDQTRFSFKTILAGILLGLPNYFSYYVILNALQDFNNEGNIVFPAGNLGVILTTGFVSYFYFKDYFSGRNLLGIGFSVLSLALLFYKFFI